MMSYSNSKVTMELRDILSMKDENGSPFVLFDFDYPSFYEGDAKKEFEQKIIDHYLFHQIGCETVARFKHNLKTRMREIMPYYIQYYKSVEIMNKIEDPFGNVDVTESTTETRTGNSSSNATNTSNANNDSTHRFSNTPQGEIDNIDNYLTEAAKDGSVTTASATSTGSGTSSESVTVTFNKKGNQGVNTYAHDMIEFRQSFINVDMMVIGALRDLFLMIY